ncbi:trypsin-like peptidase domain-containing protein [Candidatus Bathyarchaeota archaeon]|nr:trypsin-like peptidase domain-containing protein [Candidatus Bathyarchaeota archaeon]
MQDEYEVHSPNRSFVAVIVVAVIVVAGIIGNIYTYEMVSSSVRKVERRVETLHAQIEALTEALGSYNQTSVGNVTLSELYEDIKDSVVLIHGYVIETTLVGQETTEVSGSGFVYNFSGSEMMVCTNYHVIEDVDPPSLTVTFRDGNSYLATKLGEDPYADFAVLSVDAPKEEFKPLPIVSSSLLKVGDLVIAVGNPYGLTGSMTTGIVSQLGRSITEPMTGGYAIADVIQISTPINPGNSGGPLLNSKGQVVGITTAIINQSQGIGFAIPSDTILREIAWLANGMEYEHSWIGVRGIDMTYEIAKTIETSTTYGWLIVSVMNNSPAAKADLRGATREVEIYSQITPVGGDIILAINNTRMMKGDDISKYLEENTRPNQTINITVERGGSEVLISLILEPRPPPT